MAPRGRIGPQKEIEFLWVYESRAGDEVELLLKCVHIAVLKIHRP
jgi:hypothetical protein